MTKKEVINEIEARGKYTSVRISADGKIMGMLTSENWRYKAKNNTGGRRLIGYLSDAEEGGILWKK